PGVPLRRTVFVDEVGQVEDRGVALDAFALGLRGRQNPIGKFAWFGYRAPRKRLQIPDAGLLSQKGLHRAAQVGCNAMAIIEEGKEEIRCWHIVVDVAKLNTCQHRREARCELRKLPLRA